MKSEREATPGAAAAETKIQDSLHLSAPQTEAKSLQPLLDALRDLRVRYESLHRLYARPTYRTAADSDRDLALALATTDYALGNRTPARQEARPNANYKCIECGWIWYTPSNCPNCAGEVTTAALRASSAPTTKGTT